MCTLLLLVKEFKRELRFKSHNPRFYGYNSLHPKWPLRNEAGERLRRYYSFVVPKAVGPFCNIGERYIIYPFKCKNTDCNKSEESVCSYNRARRFCSFRCQQDYFNSKISLARWLARQIKDERAPCKYCNKAFERKRFDQKFCSVNHRVLFAYHNSRMSLIHRGI